MTNIRLKTVADVEAIVALSLRAWAPVFDSMRGAMLPEVYGAFYPEGWEASQRKAVAAACGDPGQQVWVAEEGGAPVGFVSVRLHPEDSMGEIYMVAVDPAHQGNGLGTALTDFAAERLREAGMKIAMVETGGDPGHAPARRTYEKAGFRLFPVARYFKAL
jgi:ribosomal protein S18 acetylase RimI-like enzyme